MVRVPKVVGAALVALAVGVPRLGRPNTTAASSTPPTRAPATVSSTAGFALRPLLRTAGGISLSAVEERSATGGDVRAGGRGEDTEVIGRVSASSPARLVDQIAR